MHGNANTNSKHQSPIKPMEYKTFLDVTVKTAEVRQLILKYSGEILKLDDRSYLSAIVTE